MCADVGVAYLPVSFYILCGAPGTNISSGTILEALETVATSTALVQAAKGANPSAFGGVVNASLTVGTIATDGITAAELMQALWGQSIISAIEIKTPTRGQTVGAFVRNVSISPPFPISLCPFFASVGALRAACCVLRAASMRACVHAIVCGFDMCCS